MPQRPQGNSGPDKAFRAKRVSQTRVDRRAGMLVSLLPAYIFHGGNDACRFVTVKFATGC